MDTDFKNMTRMGKYFPTFRVGLAAMYFGFISVAAALTEESHNGVLDCGADKFVLFDGSTSKDGRYAIGWTLRPASPATKPVDWSLWHGANPYDFLDKYEYCDPSTGETAGSPYELVDCAVDLKQKRILRLPSAWPYWPNKGHGELRVIWSAPTGGAQYAIVDNDGRYGTADLWLLTARESGMREVELSDRLDEEVDTILKAKRPLAYKWYSINYLPNSDDPDIFTGSTVRVDFAADVPKNGYEPVEGTIVVNVAHGTITETKCDTPRDDPFKDNPDLARADEELNRTYAELLGRLDETQRAELRKEERAWLANKDYGYPVNTEDDADTFNQKRDEVLIESTKGRTAELRKRFGGS